MECDFCKTKQFENWKGDGGLTGIRCKNKCWSNYKIDIISMFYPREDFENGRRKSV